VDSIRQDFVYALKRLRSAPGFTLVAVATLALGIGATGALFSVVNGVLLRPLPYPEPEGLVRVAAVYEGRRVAVMSPLNFLDTAAAARSFEHLAAFDQGGYTLTGRGEPVRLDGAEVSAPFFELLRVPPFLGRGFRAEENEPSRSKVVVLGHGLWRERFGGDPAVVGKDVTIDGEPRTVMGVAPAGFSFPDESQLWLPLAYDEVFRVKSRGAWYLNVIGRLRPGVALPVARAELETIATRLEREHPDQNEKLGMTAVGLQDDMVGGVRLALLVLLGAVGFVLLIACVNVANLLLARLSARETELAVRTAIGAGRWRLARQLLTEALVLGLAGGAAGLMVAVWGTRLLLELQPGDLPRAAEVGVDWSVAGFAAGVSILASLLFGSVPALRASRRDPGDALREAGRGLHGGQGRLGPGLVVAEVALAVTLLVGAGLLIRSFVQLRRVDPGFQTASALTFRISLPESSYSEEARRSAFYQDLVERLSALPGVRAAGATAGLPLSGVRFNLSFEVEGRPKLSPAQQPSMEIRVVSPEYFEAIGMPVLAGRGFTPQDVDGAPPVMVLSRSAVRRFFPGEDALGKSITLGWRRPAGRPNAGGTVVGIVGDVKDRGLAEEHPPEAYLAHAQLPLLNMDLVLRAATDPMASAAAAIKTVHGLDPELPVTRVRTLEQIVSRSIATPRFYAQLLAFFAASALLLAALGVFGVLSYAVSRRSREIGVRVALGARPGDVLRMVLGQALRLAALGLLLGAVAAAALSRALVSLLFELSPTDPATFAAVALVLAGAALLAATLPARRAARLDPLQALRSE
jgi:predicted permease